MRHESYSANFVGKGTPFEVVVSRDVQVEYVLSPNESISVNVVMEDIYPIEKEHTSLSAVAEESWTLSLS